MKKLTTKQKAQIVELIAQYHSEGTVAIEKASELYVSFGGELTSEDFYKKVVGENNSNISEIDNIDFMYNSDTQQWADDTEMAEWFDSNIN